MPRVAAKRYYPYHRVLIRYSARTLLGESALKISCIVDARTGVASTVDPFEIEEVEVAEDEVIIGVIGEAEARQITERYVAYVVRNRRKALVVPKTEVLEHGVVHRPFWIVRCEDGSTAPFRVLVDGITGGFHVLHETLRSEKLSEPTIGVSA